MRGQTNSSLGSMGGGNYKNDTIVLICNQDSKDLNGSIITVEYSGLSKTYT
jgi:hypothetical protein